MKLLTINNVTKLPCFEMGVYLQDKMFILTRNFFIRSHTCFFLL